MGTNENDAAVKAAKAKKIKAQELRARREHERFLRQNRETVSIRISNPGNDGVSISNLRSF